MYYYVVNPAAGPRIQRIEDELRSRLRELGIAGEFAKALDPADVPKLARQGVEAGAKTVVAVGGDETVSELVRVLYGKEGVALGVIPTGERNYLAGLLGVTSWEEAPRILAARKIEEVDLGEVGGRYFIGEVKVGFEAAYAKLQPGAVGGRFGRAKTLPAYLKALRRWRPSEISLSLDGKTFLKTPCFTMTISNSRDSGFGFASADPQDRRLDVTVVASLSRRSVFRQIPGFLGGELERADEVSLFRATKIEIEGRHGLPISIDGETGGGDADGGPDRPAPDQVGGGEGAEVLGPNTLMLE